MATNWGRRPITDATKPKPVLTYFYDGEERIDRRPLGRAVERFVDPQGNVVSLQLAGDGDPQRAMTIDRMRMQYRRDGFVEHAKCPLRHGTAMMAGPVGKDFSSMPKDMGEACNSDPRTLTKIGHELHAGEACPHIEWLITERRRKEAEQNAKRNAARIAQEKHLEEKRDLEVELLEMAKEQIKERKTRKGAKASKVIEE